MADQATQDLTEEAGIDATDQVYTKEAAVDGSRREDVFDLYPGELEVVQARVVFSNSGGNNTAAIVDEGAGGIQPRNVDSVILTGTQITIVLSKTYTRFGTAFMVGNSVLVGGYLFAVETADLDEIVFRCVSSALSLVNPQTDSGLVASGNYVNFEGVMFPV